MIILSTSVTLKKIQTIYNFIIPNKNFITEKTLELLHRGANKNISRNNNEIIATEPSKKTISNHYIENEKKPLRQMFIGNNLNLHSNGEVNVTARLSN